MLEAVEKIALYWEKNDFVTHDISKIEAISFSKTRNQKLT